MSIKLDEAFVMAAVGLSPLAEAVIRDRAEDFKTDEEFAPYFPLLRGELVDFLSKVNTLAENGGLAKTDVNNPEEARNIVNLIRIFAYKKVQIAVTATPSVTLPPPTHSQASAVSTPVNYQQPSPHNPGVPFHIGREPKEDPNGSNGCFARNCGKKFLTFNEVMAHKVLIHGYTHPKYNRAWAENIVQCLPAGLTVPYTVAASVGSQDPDPGLIVQTNLWTPKLHLDLRNLDLQHGEASRFAAGEQHDARFYFIRLLKKQTVVKGKFVWTKFGHRFSSEYVYEGDFVVRKLAGDTKEWVGIQKKAGVYNPAYSYNAQPPVPRLHFENVYVGEHEDDILEILNDPHKARVNYGLWRQECGYCGRNLTDAVSRQRGVGPECYQSRYLSSLQSGRP